MTRLSGRDFAARPHQANSRSASTYGNTHLAKDDFNPRRGMIRLLLLIVALFVAGTLLAAAL